jgi:hypothetical protein
VIARVLPVAAAGTAIYAINRMGRPRTGRDYALLGIAIALMAHGIHSTAPDGPEPVDEDDWQPIPSGYGIAPCRCRGEGCTTCHGDGVIYP